MRRSPGDRDVVGIGHDAGDLGITQGQINALADAGGDGDVLPGRLPVGIVGQGEGLNAVGSGEQAAQFDAAADGRHTLNGVPCLKHDNLCCCRRCAVRGINYAGDGRIG